MKSINQARLIAALAMVLAVTGCTRDQFDARTAIERFIDGPDKLNAKSAAAPEGSEPLHTAPILVPLPGEVAEFPTQVSQAAPPQVSAPVPIRRVDRVAPIASPRVRSVVTAPSVAAVANPSDTVRLQFDDAPVSEVAQVILGDILNRNHVVDAGIDDRITLSTAQPIARANAAQLFSTVLASRGLGLTEVNGIYRIFRDADALQVRPAAFTSGTGGMQVYPLRHVPASEVKKVLAALVPEERLLTVGGQDRLLIATGSPQELAAIGEAIATFDVSELAGIASMLVTLQSADAVPLVEELTDIFLNEGGAGGSDVRFVAVPRLNGIVVIAPDEELVDHAFDWIRRLDRTSSGTGERLFVYRLQHRRASDLAGSLKELLSIGALPELVVADAGGQASPAEGEAAARSVLTRVQAGPKSQIVVDEANNALIIRASAAEYRQIRDLVRQLDTVPLQVMIEATILEVTLGDNLTFGIEYALKTGKVPGFSQSNAVFSGNQTNLPLQPGLPGFSFILGGFATPEIVLEALSSITNVKVLSSPKLLVVDNETAVLQVGDSVPTIVQSSANTSGVTGGGAGVVVTNAIVYRDTGVRLEVKPRINSRQLVNLDISQEVSDVLPTTTSGIDSPTIRQRRLLTSIAVRGGQTIMLGGLIQDREQRGRSGIPLLMDIPLIGDLVSRQEDVANRTELIALLTPHVIANANQAQALSQRLQRKFHALSLLDFERDRFVPVRKRK